MSALRIKLGDAVTFLGGGTPSKSREDFWGGAIPWATVKDLRGTELKETLECITELGVERSATRVIPPKTVVIPTRMALGRAAITSCEMAINQDLKALVPKIEIDERYLLRVMLHLKPAIERLGSGSTVKGVTLERLQKLEIPVPPIEQQKRVAEVLDRADILREMCERSLEELDRLQQSVFLDMFGDPVTNPKRLPICNLGECADIIVGFPFKSSKFIEAGDGIPLCRGVNVGVGELSWHDRVDWNAERYPVDEDFMLLPEDIVLAMDRPWISSGLKIATVNKGDSPALLVQRVARIRQSGNLIMPVIYQLLTSPLLKRHCRITETTIPHISRQDILSIPVPIPPYEEQVKFGLIALQLAELRANFQEQILQSVTLLESIQQKAFAGRL